MVLQRLQEDGRESTEMRELSVDHLLWGPDCMPHFYGMQEQKVKVGPLNLAAILLIAAYYSCHYERVTIHIIDYRATCTIKDGLRKSVSVEVNPCRRPVYLGL